MLRLFLNNKEVELDSNVSFAINKQFEDISSPADIKNDWSKTVQIPFTQANNKLFGELFNVDRLIVDGDDKLMGIYFNPYKKVDFRLQWGDTIIMQGYAKNIDVNKTSVGGHYNITLNGELGKCFQEMKKITFDTTTEDTKYLIDGSKYVNTIITKELIADMWSNEPNFSKLDLVENTDSNYRIYDFIGFAPNNSYNEGFDYTTYELPNSKTKTFAETLDDKAVSKLGEGKTYVDLTGITSENAIGDGLLPREIGEYRSYMQLPYIYFNKLFQIFMNKTKEITGYDVELDKFWFSEDNYYWGKMVYMLNPLSTKKSESIENTYGMELYEDTTYKWNSKPKPPLTFKLNPVQSISNENINVVDWTANPPVFNLKDIIIPQDGYKFTLKAPALTVNGVRQDSRLYKSNGLVITLNVIYDNGEMVTTKTLFIDENSALKSVINPSDYDKVIEIGKGDNTLTMTTWFLTIPLNPLYSKNGATTARFEITASWLRENLQCFDNVDYAEIGTYNPDDVKMYVYNNLKHSYSNFTLNDLWNNEYNLFDEILNYCKQYRIGVFCDDINKKLIFKPFATYFKDYNVLDWTAKLDLSKEYLIKPITFENKYLLFNYEKYETELNKKYNEKYGCNYGEYKLTTQYEFNTTTKDLFKYSKISIPNTDLVLSWTNLYSNNAFIYTLPAEISIYNKDKDRKNVNVFGSMLFYSGLSNFDTSSDLRGVKISDDTNLQLSTQKYHYSQESNTISVSKYPLLDIVADSNITTFAIPNENYTCLVDSYNNTNGVFHNFWEDYLNERYNKQNKIVSCYLYLTPYDIANFQYNNFVKIENQLYMVNKIYDYQITDSNSTKVDLITVQNLKGYTDNNFHIFNLYRYSGANGGSYTKVDEVNINMVYNTTYTVYFTSDVPVSWESDAGIQLGVEVNGEAGSGTIPSGFKVPARLYVGETGSFSGYLTFTNGKQIKKIKINVQ